MHKVVAVAQLYPIIEEKLRAGGHITLTITGNSMLPMLHHQRDTVVIGPILHEPLINDVVLYRRENGDLVLHRIVGKEKNGDYVLCGDNQFVFEHHISRHQMVGLLRTFTHGGRNVFCTSLSYKSYVYLLKPLRRLRQVVFRCNRYLEALSRLARSWANKKGDTNGS